MNVLGVDVPCGCEARKEIMFTQGNWDRSLIVAAVALLLAIPLTGYVMGRLAR